MLQEWNDKIFAINDARFQSLTLEVFRFQYHHNIVYRTYLETLKIQPSAVQSIEQIPFLPISFFKSHRVQTDSFNPQKIFESSGTTGESKSRHMVKDLLLYEHSFSQGFKMFYGPVENYCIVALLPSYLERKNSSLIYMVEMLIKQTKHSDSSFYLNEYDKLFEILNKVEKQQQKTLLIGVSFALLDFAEKFHLSLQHTIVMETGGMKGRRKEMIRPELHATLQQAFGISNIHSEYGMTELLSQAYSKGKGIFHCPPWMKVFIRDEEDPLSVRSGRQPAGGGLHDVPLAGAINIIDLANVHSCSFIATDDIGKLYSDGGFEVLGRMDNSDIRGCSLMTA